MEEGVTAPEEERKNDFSKGSVRSAIMRLTLPMTVAQLLNVLYSIIDRVYLGHVPGIGWLALTGVGITFPIITILTAFANLAGMGGAPLASIFRGHGDDREAERVMGNSFTLLLLFGVVLTAAVLIFRRPILYLFGASDETFPYANSFLTIYSLGTLFVMISLGMNPFINSQGFAKMGMMTVLLGAVINIALDPIFIFALHMNTAGAATATVIAQFCSCVWVLKFVTGKKVLLRLKLSNMRLKAGYVKRILSLGLAGFFMNVTTSLVQTICNTTLLRFGGDLYVGVMTVVASVRDVIQMPIAGLNNGFAPVVGYNFGAGEYDRVRQGIRFSMVVTVVYSAAAWAVIMLIPGSLMRIFTTDTSLISDGIPAMRIFFMLFIFMSLHMSSQNVFVSLGRSKSAIFFSLLRKALIGAPLTLLLPRLGYGTNGVFYAEAASQLISGVVCSITMYFTAYRQLGKKLRPKFMESEDKSIETDGA